MMIIVILITVCLCALAFKSYDDDIKRAEIFEYEEEILDEPKKTR